MSDREQLRDDILVAMSPMLDAQQVTVLEAVLVKALSSREVVKMETLPATVDDTNEYILKLFDVKKAPKLSATTAEYYKSTVYELIALINKPLTEITEIDVDMYLEAKRAAGCGAVAINNYRRNLSAFYTWLRKMKLVSENPCDGVEKYDEPEKPIDHLEAIDFERVKTGCKNKRDRALLEVLRSTAMRRGEVPLVKVNDIDFRSGKILIYGHKANKYRIVFLDQVALAYVKEYLDERGVDEKSCEPLFTHLRKKEPVALGRDGLYDAIREIQRRSDLDRTISPHVFRRTTATNICKRGGTEDAAGEYLGHAPKNVTGKHYTFKSEQHVEQIFRQFVEAV